MIIAFLNDHIYNPKLQLGKTFMCNAVSDSIEARRWLTPDNHEISIEREYLGGHDMLHNLLVQLLLLTSDMVSFSLENRSQSEGIVLNGVAWSYPSKI